LSRKNGGDVVSGYSIPNTDEFAEKMCQLDGAVSGISTGSGMAAIFSSLAALLDQGDHVLACRSLFGSPLQILDSIFSRWGISHTYVDIDKPGTWEKQIQDNTRVMFLESPSNPGLELDRKS